ncbi:MAG: Ig-like domain-containing protein [Bacilli bacterium]|nr:Ig-like domain-containing protein [Bacilli bacterium]
MKHKSLFLIPLAACLILAGCGDENTPKTSASETPASASSDVGSLPVSSEAPVSSSVAPKPATGVAIAEGATATVKKGKTLTLHATVTPDDADDKTVTWSSENAAIASVSAAGVVTGVAKGTVKITASSAVQGVKAEISITVLETTITISGEDSAYIGGEIQLSAATENAEGTVAWSSSAPAIASVDQNGKVSALAEGDAVITAAVDGVSATKTVHILAHKLDAAKMGLPASYKMEVSYTREVTIEQTGAKETPLSYHPSADNANGVLIDGNSMPSDGLYYRFTVVTAGTYRLYSNGSADTEIKELYKYNADGTVPSDFYNGFTKNDTYSSSTYPASATLCGNNDDFYTEVALEEGDYLVRVYVYSYKRGQFVFHIETTDADNPVYPDGPTATKEVTDTYSLYRKESVGYYTLTTKSGVALKDGKAYGYSLNEREHEYQLSNKEIAGFDLASTSLANFASAGVASYVKTEEGKDYFTVSSASGFGHDVIDLLGLDPELAGDFEITADSTTGAIASIKLAVGEAVCDVSVTEISELPITVVDYPVVDDGEYDGGGAVQDW